LFFKSVKVVFDNFGPADDMSIINQQQYCVIPHCRNGLNRPPDAGDDPGWGVLGCKEKDQHLPDGLYIFFTAWS
jgi:hypothetical protein